MTPKQLQEYLAGRRITKGSLLYSKNRQFRVKITSIKIWKTRTTRYPDGRDIHKFIIGWKFGLYQYGSISNFESLHKDWLSDFEYCSLPSKT